MDRLFFPYRTAHGGRNILMAIDRDDARHFLKSINGDTVFCEVRMTPDRQSEILESPDRVQIIDRWLEKQPIFIA